MRTLAHTGSHQTPRARDRHTPSRAWTPFVRRALRWAGAWALVLACALWAGPPRAEAQTENLINRISNEKMHKFEDRLTDELNKTLSQYISKKQYVLAVKVIWNPDVMPMVDAPQGEPEQQKLPGFPIFVRAPDAPVADDGTPPFVRLEVKVLIDETLPEYYERFVRKIVPIVARMDFNRGDQVVVLKETFPVLPLEEQVPTLSEKELMDQLGKTPQPGQMPQQAMMGAPPIVVAPQMAAPSGAFSPQAAQTPAQAAQLAYDEGRYPDALRIAQAGFQRATSNQEKGFFLGLQGSVLYTQGNVQAAKAAWKQAIAYDPANMEVRQVLNYVESQPAGGAKP